ncbi:MAG: hypothetical protein J6D54_04910 [Olsenella sp.]|nr:hypothetical protein [Olsenella sp.]
MVTRSKALRRLSQLVAVTTALALMCGLMPAGVLASSVAPDDTQKGLDAPVAEELAPEASGSEGETDDRGNDRGNENVVAQTAGDGESEAEKGTLPDADGAQSEQGQAGSQDQDGQDQDGQDPDVPGKEPGEGQPGLTGKGPDATEGDDSIAILGIAAVEATPGAQAPEGEGNGALSQASDAASPLSTQSEARVYLGATAGGSVGWSCQDGTGTAKSGTVNAGETFELTGGNGPSAGSTVGLVATPASGYVFKGWYKQWNSTSPQLVSASPSYSYQMPTDYGETLTAAFEPESASKWAAVALGSTGGGSVSGTFTGSSGSGSIGIGNTTFEGGAQVSLTATPESGYSFVGWYQGVIGSSHFVESNDGTLVSASNPYSFTAGPGSSTLLQAVFVRSSGASDVYIDNTVDQSVSHVIGNVHITGSGGTQAGYASGKEVFREDVAVTYSTPKTAQVQGKINDAYTKVYNLANACKRSGKRGEFHMSTSETTGAVWDHRVYTTYVYYGDKDSSGNYIFVNSSNPNDTVLSPAMAGEPSIGDRTHVASGGFGKETIFRVEANGWVAGYGITVSDDGFGTGAADLAASLAGETVTLTATQTGSSAFLRWEVVSGEITLADALAATTTFTMPASDVEVRATFHTHELTRTEQVDPTCTRAGTKAYWTCGECGKTFSDAEGKNEIGAPEEVPALGHDWGEWSDADGKATHVCRRCGEAETIIVEYVAAAGDGSSWTMGSSDDLSFTFKRNVNDDKTFGNFKGIKVDGTDVAASDYLAERGSAVVSLKGAYLGGLVLGSHTLTAVFEDGAADATFTVVEAPAASAEPKVATAEPKGPESKDLAPAAPKPSSPSPQTGDGALAVANAVLPLACCGIAFVVASRRMRKASSHGRRTRR